MTQACTTPQRLPNHALTQAAVEVYWGRDRAALRKCGGQLAGLTGWVAEIK